MSAIDVDALCTEISPEAPSGPDPNYEADFIEMEQLSIGTPERQVGDSVIPAEDPDWKQVAQRAESVFGRSRHLRAAVLLARARLATHGIEGLEAGLRLVLAMLKTRWADMHPQLDPDDANDPTERMNIVASLTDQRLFCRPITNAPLTNSRQIGRFSLRNAMVAMGEADRVGDEEHPDGALLDAAFDDTPTEELQATLEAIQSCASSIEAINAYLMETVGAGSTPDLGGVEGTIGDVAKLVRAHLARRGYGAPDEGGDEGSDEGGGDGGGGPRLSGEIRSQQDVLLALDKVIRYYDQAELSSPVPLLVRCAQRMVSKSFLEISRVMPPDVVRVIEEVSGLRDGESS